MVPLKRQISKLMHWTITINLFFCTRRKMEAHIFHNVQSVQNLSLDLPSAVMAVWENAQSVEKTAETHIRLAIFVKLLFSVEKRYRGANG